MLHGAGCPSCRQLIRLVDISTLAAQYRGLARVSDMKYAAHERVPWTCRTWAVDPANGSWRPVEHHFEAVVKERALQADACRVCAGYVVDDTNSLRTWFPEIADELDDPDADACRLPTTRHNVPRRQAAGEEYGGVYATFPWRCRRGHCWEATILNRVQGGGCPSCSLSGISKEQVRLVAELAGLIPLVPPGPTDPRLPDDLPDFSSHQLVVPPQHKPDHWRYKAVEVDAVFQLAVGIRIGVEYDGAFHHSIKRRDRRQYESEKGQVLVAADLLDLLVHVRLGDLPRSRPRRRWRCRCRSGPPFTSRHAPQPRRSKPGFRVAFPDSTPTSSADTLDARTRLTHSSSLCGANYGPHGADPHEHSHGARVHSRKRLLTTTAF